MQLDARIRIAAAGITFMLAGFAFPASAEDIVYIFDGGGLETVRGEIVKMKPGGSLTIVTNEGNELTFDADEIANVVRDASETLTEDAVDSEEANWSSLGRRNKRAFSFYGWAGYGSQSLGHVNASIKEDEELLAGLGIPGVEFDTFGAAPDFGAGMSYRALRSTHVGLEVGYQKSVLLTAFLDTQGAFTNTIELRVIDIVGNVEVDVPWVRGAFIGGSAGASLGNATQEYHFQDFVDSANNDDSYSDWDGSDFTYGTYAGFRLSFAKSASAFLKTGYRMRNLGNFKGNTQSETSLSGPTEPVDNSLKPIEFDFSGAYARVGIAFTVGS